LLTVILRTHRHPRGSGIQYAAAFWFYRNRQWNTGSPGPSAQLRTRPGDDTGDVRSAQHFKLNRRIRTPVALLANAFPRHLHGLAF